MWEKIYSVTQLQTGAPFPINYHFNQSILIVKATASNARLTWHRAGIFYPILLIPEIGTVQSKSIQIKLGSQIVQIFNPSNYQFTAEYETVDWFVDINLEFWSNPVLTSVDISSQINNLNQLAVENRQNVALIQQQLDRIEQDINTTTGQ